MTPTHSRPTKHLSRHAHRQTGALAFILCLALVPVQAQAQFEEDFDDPYKPWQEVAVQLPAAPQPENLLSFYVSPSATHDFMVDAKSLSVGADGVVRYTLVTSSRSGARNVSYEGIRCGSVERKQYAFGQSDGSWSRARRDQWEVFSGTGANRYHAVLARDYFCDVGTVAGNAKQILYRLQNRQPLTRIE